MGENIEPNFVVDASFVIAYLLPDENVHEVDLVFDRFAGKEINLFSTYLLPFEVTNSLNVAIIRKRVSKMEAEELLNRFLRLRILAEEVSFTNTFLLAHHEKLTVYDASYITLAQQHNIPLLTLDKNLQNIAKKSSI